MGILLFILKVLIMLGLICLMAAPLFLEFLSFRKDKEAGISHKRFRILLYSVVYFILITIVMTLLKDILLWVKSWSFIQWLGMKLTLPSRFEYCLSVFGVIALNFAIGALFKFSLGFVRIGLKKKNIVKPQGENDEYTFTQKVERAVLNFFHAEKWFFAAKILLFLCITLSAAYSILFFCYQLPIFFGAEWIPYAFLVRIFDAVYIYPVITLIPLFEAYFFLAGVELLEKECPEFFEDPTVAIVDQNADIKKINEECKRIFKDYFRCEIEGCDAAPEVSSTQCHEITRIIAESIEHDQRNPQRIKECYLKCLDAIVTNDLNSAVEGAGKKTTGVLVNGGFFTEFSMYFLRYVSAILSRGDNVVFVCNDDEQIEATYSYVNQAFSQLYSLYYGGNDINLNFDDPIWKICKISGDDRSNIERFRIDDCSVLVTDLKYLCSSDFEKKHSAFAHLIDTVVFVDVLTSVNTYSHQISMFNTSVKNIRDINELRAKNSSEKSTDKNGNATANNHAFNVRYTSKQIKYVCFDDSRTPGIDKVLKNLLSVDFVSADAMKYAPSTIICCYNYDGMVNENGVRVCPQTAKTTEELGVLVNMADFALAFGAGKVSIFADRKVPYADISESLSANANNGLLAQENVNLLINRPRYNPDDYTVIVAFDTEDNLPEMVRRYAAMTPEKPTLVMIFSRPYLLRDFYAENIETLWKPEQIMRIPVEQSGKQNAIQKILVRANTGGISKEEIFAIFRDYRIEDYKTAIEENDLSAVLRKILIDCGISQNNALDLFRYFEYNSFRNFDKDGCFVCEDKVCIRKTGALFDLITGRNLIRLVTEGGELVMPLTKERLTQNFIVGQNMLYNGSIYTIENIDTVEGKMYISHATGGRNNVSYQYLQDREYHIDWSDEYSETLYSRKHNEPNGGEGMNVKEVYVSVKRRPMEVLTKGYTPIDHRTLSRNGSGKNRYVDLTGKDHIDLFKQTYRKYGTVVSPVCPSDVIMNSKVDLVASPNGAMVMSIRLVGEFGENASRIATLASSMLGEILRSMFPSVGDGLAVCPVVSKNFDDDESRLVLNKHYKAFCRGYEPSDKDIEILIIEDCSSDLGVISVLMSSGDDVVKTLFAPIYKYLEWYSASNKKSDFLYYGLDHEPSCFDFSGLKTLSGILGNDNFSLSFVEVETVAEYDVCDFCGKRYIKGDDVTTLEDGRKMCKNCAENLVGNNKKSLKAHLDRARMFLESTYGIILDEDYEFCFESTVKIANTLRQNRNLNRRGTDVPLRGFVDDRKKVHVEYSIPSVSLSELLVRELTYVWQLKHIPDVAEDLAEGHIALVAIQYLRFLNQNSLATIRTTYYETNNMLSGEGYRRLVSELLANPLYKNNPFRYLLGNSDNVIQEETIIPPPPKVEDTGDYGAPYKSETPDRALDGNLKYFFRQRFSTQKQAVYDLLLESIRNHEPQVTVDGCSFEEVVKISEAISYDHPELFWYKTFSMAGNLVYLKYGATADEAEELQRRIDEVVPKYLEGIDDTMSAYDVAIRIHVRVIASVDYDTIALEKQRAEGGPPGDEIDYLRTICGVFLDGKAVCEGYARAVQYLLQKCGVESAEVAGYIRKENGENGGGHAWNIVKIDGEYYYMDTTWDDSSNTVQTVKTTNLGYDYFCITTEELTRTRDTDLNPTDVPNCTATKANYYYHNGMVLNSFDPEKIKAIAGAAAAGKKKSFTFKCGSKAVYDQAMSALSDVNNECYYDALKAANKADKSILDTTYSYTYNPNIRTITILFKYK